MKKINQVKIERLKLYKLKISDFIENDQELSCPECNYKISSFMYILSPSKKEAINQIKKYIENPDLAEIKPLCSDCIADTIAENRYTILKTGV